MQHPVGSNQDLVVLSHHLPTQDVNAPAATSKGTHPHRAHPIFCPLTLSDRRTSHLVLGRAEASRTCDPESNRPMRCLGALGCLIPRSETVSTSLGAQVGAVGNSPQGRVYSLAAPSFEQVHTWFQEAFKVHQHQVLVLTEPCA